MMRFIFTALLVFTTMTTMTTTMMTAVAAVEGPSMTNSNVDSRTTTFIRGVRSPSTKQRQLQQSYRQLKQEEEDNKNAEVEVAEVEEVDEEENNDDDKNDNQDNDDDQDIKNEIPDDIYHCRDPKDIADWFWKDKTVQCDWDSHEWVMEELDENQIPEHCADNKWEWDGNLEKLKDWNEPCYLWMVAYGGLNGTSTVPSLAPTVMPSLDPSLEPTLSPTSVPSMEPTWIPTSAPSFKPKSEQPSRPSLASTTEAEAVSNAMDQGNDTDDFDDYYVIDADDKEKEENNENLVTPTQTQLGGPKVYEISTMVITYMIDPVPTTSSTTTTINKLQSRHGNGYHYFLRRNLNKQEVMDRQILEDVTSNHVQKDLQRQIVFWWEQVQLRQRRRKDDEPEPEPLEISADITMTSVRHFILPDETVAITEAISGFVSLRGPPTFQDYPELLHEYVDAAFEGKSLQRYQDSLRASGDPVLERTSMIEIGLPLDLLNGNSAVSGSSTVTTINNNNNDGNAVAGTTTSAASSTSSTNDDGDDEEGEATSAWTVLGVEVSLTTLAIVAAGIAAFAILLLLCVCYKLSVIRKENIVAREDNGQIVTKGTGSTDDDMKVTPVATHKKKSKRSQSTVKTKNGKRNNSRDGDLEASESIDADDPGGDRYFQRFVAETDDDQRSLATSTYSYLDSNLHDHGNASMAPSYMYGYGNDDASLQSKTMWSLIDGINNDENYNYDQTASPAHMNRRKEEPPQTPTDVLDIVKSPSNMMITTASKNGGYIDEDDDVTMASLATGTYAEYLHRMRHSKDDGDSPTGESRASPTSTSQNVDAGINGASKRTTTVTSKVKAPLSLDDGSTNPFAEVDPDAKLAARMGVSARKKSSPRNSAEKSVTPSSSVCKALGQLTSCGKSRSTYDGIYSESTSVPDDSANSCDDSTMKEVNRRVQQPLTDSTSNSKNSSLVPDKLFNDTTLESNNSLNMDDRSTATNPTTSAINTSELLKDQNGNYLVETMTSF